VSAGAKPGEHIGVDEKADGLVDGAVEARHANFRKPPPLATIFIRRYEGESS
jgi:hypothetical protein